MTTPTSAGLAFELLFLDEPQPSAKAGTFQHGFSNQNKGRHVVTFMGPGGRHLHGNRSETVWKFEIWLGRRAER